MSEQNSSANSGSDAQNPYAPPSVRVDDVLPDGDIVLADRGTRLASAIIDTIIVTIFQFALGFALGVGFGAVSQPSIGMTLGMTMAGIVFMIAINFYLLNKYGQTIGKRLMNIRIARPDGSKATIGRIIGARMMPVWIVSAIPMIGPLIAVVDVLFIFRENRKCLHDNIADTIVVKTA